MGLRPVRDIGRGVFLSSRHSFVLNNLSNVFVPFLLYLAIKSTWALAYVIINYPADKKACRLGNTGSLMFTFHNIRAMKFSSQI